MSKSFDELCQDDDYVRDELVEAQRLMGLKTTDFVNLGKGLAMLYLHSGKRWRDMVEATLLECTWRGMLGAGLFPNTF